MSNKYFPFYEGQTHELPPPGEGNAGLYFDRFYDGYFDSHGNFKSTDNESAKGDFLKKFARNHGNREQLEQHAYRQISLAESVGGSSKVYILEGHFVTGMGNAHPVENGFLWHYTLGVPYLAGSQVKGMVRSMIERYLDADTKDKGALLLKWFGSIDKEPPKNPLPKDDTARVGELIFFDALPYQPPLLTVDIMTPHMGDWYAKGGDISSLQDSDKIPADWHEPIPIPFLAVRDAKFVFSIGKRSDSDIDLAEVWDVLDKALNYLGAGAKTNTGFGYMSEDTDEMKSLSEKFAAKQKNQRMEEKRQAEIADLENDNQRFISNFIYELNKLEESKWHSRPSETINISINGNNYWFAEVYKQVESWESAEDIQYALDKLFLLYLPKYLGKKISQHKKWKERISNLEKRINSE